MTASPRPLAPALQKGGTLDAHERLLDRGYEPLPIPAGQKGPRFSWNRPITLAVVADVLSRQPTASNIGLRCGTLVGLDNDIPDPTAAYAIDGLLEGALSFTPLRRQGRKPAATRFYRTDQPMPRQAVTGTLNGQRFEVAALSAGSQVLAFGRHPSGIDISWRGASPLDVPLAELRTVTADQIGAALLQTSQHLVRLGAILDHRPMGPRPTANTHHRPTVVPARLLRTWLARLDPDMEQRDWVRVLWALKDHAAVGGDVREIAEEWSSQGSKWDPDHFAAVWDTPVTSVRANTFYWYLRQAPAATGLRDRL
jgi:Primase C terminal 2 (PriCT-2)